MGLIQEIVNCVKWLPRNKDIYKYDYGSLEEKYLLYGTIMLEVVVRVVF